MTRDWLIKKTNLPKQVSVQADVDFRLVLEGKASNGGFAIDHLVFYQGKCSSK